MKIKFILYLLIIIAAVTLTYSNHFNNTFHFDDGHTIEGNIFIRSLDNIPLFFKDASTISSNPMNQTYRPVVTLSLAIDYYLGDGLNPFYFHLSMFSLFLLQLILMFFLFRKVFNVLGNHKWNDYIALFTVALYGLHTAIAETLNYIISRTDSMSTLCVVAAFLIYIAYPQKRKWMLYLIPVAIGLLIKEQAAMFAPILFFYVLLFENKMSLYDIFSKSKFPLLLKTFKSVLPALLLSFIGAVFVIKMQTDTFTPGGTSAFDYFITQPWVYLRYFITFFIPVNLSADSDWKAFNSIFDQRVIVGFVFMFVLAYTAFKTSQHAKYRPVSWGILWFFFALLPTSSFIPLAEVTNDHRMFFPFVGLAAGLTWYISRLLLKYEKKIDAGFMPKFLLILSSVLILGAHAWGVRERNKVWHTEESLWYDVTIKSPANGRGLMNYGLSLMRSGNLTKALEYYNRALVFMPNYPYLQINLGVVKNAMGQINEAEFHYKRGVELGPNYSETNYFYALYLNQHNRNTEAMAFAEKAKSLSPAHMPTRHLLITIYVNLGLKQKRDEIIAETLKLFPDDAVSKQYMNADMSNASNDLQALENKALSSKLPEDYLNLSLAYYNNSRFDDCIEACNEALKIKPDYPQAYNNICSAHNAMQRWDEAIEACTKSLEINPSYELARNNLNYALQQKKQRDAK